ncbi:MAG: Hsp70 family protein [Candidatus Eremiobacteraeota bacterium]|nr:Hsp70 family protein [Candidatus Eremiobacteraeota bacterium]MCW5872652.1 Hsp70 family protein [Candidatus Eremiobacteraeota bacterium]
MIVGIDLGTTNCALAYVQDEGVQDFAIPQLVAPDEVEARPTLPSYLYLPSQHEFALGSLSLPWDEVAEFAVGTMARDEGSKVPDRLIVSAKSWLCNAQVDRQQPLLPWKSAEEVPKLSPVEVTTRYLRHLADSWRFSRTGGSLSEHSVFLTVPASFDAVARELTVEAAQKAGLENLTLLEEPQAAFYAWLEQMGEAWREAVKLGDHILVCDLGGGTSDFTLIRVDEDEGQLSLTRLAVGDHLLLGGDNMDLGLAATVQARLRAEGQKIDSWQFQVLTHLCRNAKEKMLAADPLELCPLTIPGRGAKMLLGSTSSEIHRSEVEKVILDGFFPRVESKDWAQRQRRFGLTELGLAYESDPAITKHLARFLHQGGEFIKPTAILFNGGVCKSPGVQARVLEVLNSWLDEPVKVLPNQDCDLAVARGAAAYGRARLQGGIRIRGGLPRSYYIGVEVARPAVPGFAPPTKAICVAPQGMEEGTTVDLPGLELGLVLGELVEFPFMTSNQRTEDQPGQTVDDWEDEDEIEQIATVTSILRSSEVDQPVVPVQLQTVATEIGTLELWCQQKGGSGRWKLEFEVRDKQ